MVKKDTNSDSLNCFTCQIRLQTEWCDLGESEIEKLNKSRVTNVYKSGEVLLQEDFPSHSVYCLESGLIGVRKTKANGKLISISLVSPGDVFGFHELLTDKNYCVSAKALKPSRICMIEATTVSSLLEKNPFLGLSVLKSLSTNLGAAEEKIFQNAWLPARARVAFLLNTLIDKYGNKTKCGQTEIHLPLARQDIAMMIGMSPETMSRAIFKLESDGIAIFTRRTVLIPSIRALNLEFEPNRLSYS